jgi:hypothetical protein
MVNVTAIRNGNPIGNIIEPNWMAHWNNEELRVMQHGDSAINKVIAWKEEGRKCADRGELLNEAAEVRDYCGQWCHLELVAGLMYRRWVPKCLKVEKLQLVSPKSIRDTIFKDLHCA